MSSVSRSQLPGLGPDPSFSFPEICKTTMPNGLKVCTVEHRTVPVVAFMLLIPIGSANDPIDKPGLAALTGDLLDEGSGAHSSGEIHDALARIGARFDTDVSSDATVLTLVTMARFADRALALLADMIRYPRFDEMEFARVRDLRITRLSQMSDVPSAVANRVFTKSLFREHPYGHMAIGTEDSLRLISVDEVVAFHRDRYMPSKTTLVAVGSLSHEQLLQAVTGAFCGEEGETHTPLSVEVDFSLGVSSFAQPSPPVERMLVVNRPSAAQSELRIGHVTVSRDTPDYHALLVLNMILGGQFVSRINLNLREDKGYTYGARTAFDLRRACGIFALHSSVQTRVTADAIREVLAEFQMIRDGRPVTESELDSARAALTRGYPQRFETVTQIARAVAHLVLYNLPDDSVSQFVPHILKVDLKTVRRVAISHLDPENLLTVIVGDRDKIFPTLNQLGFGHPIEVPPDENEVISSN